MTTTPNNDTNVSQIAPQADSSEVVEKKSFVTKTKTFARNHKKPLIAVGALVALVGVSAVTGRKTANSTPNYEPTPEAIAEAEVALEEMGITVTAQD